VHYSSLLPVYADKEIHIKPKDTTLSYWNGRFLVSNYGVANNAKADLAKKKKKTMLIRPSPAVVDIYSSSLFVENKSQNPAPAVV
jgi:hypothetical protein